VWSIFLFPKQGYNQKEVKIVRAKSQGQSCLFIAKLTSLTAFHRIGAQALYDFKEQGQIRKVEKTGAKSPLDYIAGDETRQVHAVYP
jgi:hypothetical protein